ncbi:neurocalcin homolog isoform X2 [Lineus longissimus]
MGGEGSKISPKDLKDVKANTEFDSKEIKTWYKDFSQSCPEGKLGKKEMAMMFTNLFPDGDPDTFTENVFRTYDTNGDGSVDFREFMIGISVTSRGSFDEKLKWAFELYDQDNNGSISKEEAIDIITAVQKMHGTAEQSPGELVDKMFESFDLNKDGKLSKEEFIEGSRKDPSFTKMLEW